MGTQLKILLLFLFIPATLAAGETENALSKRLSAEEAAQVPIQKLLKEADSLSAQRKYAKSAATYRLVILKYGKVHHEMGTYGELARNGLAQVECLQNQKNPKGMESAEQIKVKLLELIRKRDAAGLNSYAACGFVFGQDETDYVGQAPANRVIELLLKRTENLAVPEVVNFDPSYGSKDQTFRFAGNAFIIEPEEGRWRWKGYSVPEYQTVFDFFTSLKKKK